MAISNLPRRMKKGFGKYETFISERVYKKRMAQAAAGGAAAGSVAGYAAGKHQSKKAVMEKKANKYIEKIATLLDKEAGIGEVGKALIRTKLAPAMSKMSRGAASSLEAISRSSAGSKVAPKVFSTPEYAQHAKAMSNLAPKLAKGMRGSEANRVVAVAARARRMGVIK